MFLYQKIKCSEGKGNVFYEGVRVELTRNKDA